ncbi:hypothetical protein PV325_012790 [Microctonus aethiopoides]|nr:hypothetical protein PV325_012790 [Microctonus aethiopoides]
MSFRDAVIYSLMRYNNTLESTSSSSDEEWNATLHNYDRKKRILRPRILGYDHVITLYSDELSRNTFRYVHELIEEDLVRHVPGSPAIPSHHQLMIAVWKMSTMDSYRPVCDRFNVGRATAVRAVGRVSGNLMFVNIDEMSKRLETFTVTSLIRATSRRSRTEEWSRWKWEGRRDDWADLAIVTA